MTRNVDASPALVGHRARIWLSWLAGVALLVLGGAYTSRSLAPAPAPTRDALWTCTVADGVEARCGRVRVPLDWAHPEGARLSLRVAVVPATDRHPARDPLFYLAGFGRAATREAPWALRVFRQLNSAHDLVFVDQRGTGASGPQTCPPPSPVPSPNLDAAALRAAAVAFVEQCLASAVRDPRHDTTAAAVRDLDRVRAELGYDRVNLYGASYGATVGLAYLQRYGAHVRTAVFDSGSLLDVPRWQRVPISAQQAFDQLVIRCARTAACAANDPEADLARVLRRLRAQPARVVAPAGAAGQQPITIDVPGFLELVTDGYLASSGTSVFLPADLRAMARGDWPTVLRRSSDIVGALVEASWAPIQLQQITIRCSDAWAAMSPREIAAAAPGSLFTPHSLATAEWQREVCARWPHDQGVSGAVTSSAPVVFLNGSADLTDPPANVAAAPRTMPQATLVTVPGAGHVVLPQGCLREQVTTFIQSGRPVDGAGWTACVRPSSLPPFPASSECRMSRS